MKLLSTLNKTHEINELFPKFIASVYYLLIIRVKWKKV